MSRAEAWAVHVATVLVGGTGLIYAFMRYLMRPADPWAVVHHPLQPTVQHLHVLTAPLLVFAAGLIWRQHVWEHLRRGTARRRRSGLALLLGLAPMIASGYLLQTTVSESWRRAWVVVHCAASGLWLLAWGVHLLAARRRRTARRREAAAPSTAGPLPAP